MSNRTFYLFFTRRFKDGFVVSRNEPPLIFPTPKLKYRLRGVKTLKDIQFANEKIPSVGDVLATVHGYNIEVKSISTNV